MVARLPTEQEVVGSSPTSGFETKRILLCFVVNGLERSDHLGVAGSTPALGFLSYQARLAQSVEHKTLILIPDTCTQRVKLFFLLIKTS